MFHVLLSSSFTVTNLVIYFPNKLLCVPQRNSREIFWGIAGLAGPKASYVVMCEGIWFLCPCGNKQAIWIPPLYPPKLWMHEYFEYNLLANIIIIVRRRRTGTNRYLILDTIFIYLFGTSLCLRFNLFPFWMDITYFQFEQMLFFSRKV